MSDLTDPYLPARSGYAPRPIQMAYGRDLTEADLSRLSASLATGAPPLRHVRAIHHRQAMLLAEGRPTAQVAAMCGTSVSRLSVLERDPTFSELVAFYTTQVAEIEFETHKRIQNTLVDILEISAAEIRERLENDESRTKMPLAELRKTAEFAADRTVAPPRATQQGSTLPPTKIELNFGWNKKEKELTDVTDVTDVTPIEGDKVV